MRVYYLKFLSQLSVSKRYIGTNRSLKYLPKTVFNDRNEQQYRRPEGVQYSLWEYALPSIIVPKMNNTTKDWSEIRDKVLQIDESITPISVDSIILNYCLKLEDLSMARSYFEFLNSTNYKMNLATLGKYFKLFYLLNVDKADVSSDEDDIYNRYQEIKKTYSVFDAATCENIILALSLTKYWQECFKVLDEMKISCVPGSLMYSALIISMFRNSADKFGWSLLEEMIDNDRTPMDSVYISYIDIYKNLKTRDEFMTKLIILFDFFKLSNVICNSEVTDKLIEVCKNFGISAATSIVTNRGYCMNCERKLHSSILTHQNFETLKQAIFEKVIVGKNVFYKTTPAELQRFTEFLKNMKKYDVVVDGLNVAYVAGTKHSLHVISKFVIAVVQHFVTQGKTVLVLGRTHMSSWPNWKQVTNNADTFLAQSLSQDDPYLLYCALHSGLNTIIVTKDLMRSHLFKLNDVHLKIMFSQWLNQAQHQIKYIDNNGKIFFRYPSPFLRTTQNNDNCWHIPYNENKESKWLCIRT